VILVVDASVALKWFLHIPDSEPDRDRALTLLAGIDDESVQLVQPAHFIAEVAAVRPRRDKDQRQPLVGLRTGLPQSFAPAPLKIICPAPLWCVQFSLYF